MDEQLIQLFRLQSLSTTIVNVLKDVMKASQYKKSANWFVMQINCYVNVEVWKIFMMNIK